MSDWPLIIVINMVILLSLVPAFDHMARIEFQRGKGLGYAEAEHALYPKGWQSSSSPWRVKDNRIFCHDVCGFHMPGEG